MYETLISAKEVETLMNESAKNVVIVDCRFSLGNAEWGRSEYAQGHIPGAVYAHLNKDLSAPVIPGKTGRHPLPDREIFLSWVKQHGISNETQVIAYDQAGGGYASRLWWMMRWLGHHAVGVLDGGLAAWQTAGLPVDQKSPSLMSIEFIPAWRDDLIVTMDEVGSWACDNMHTVVDSREAYRYAGIEEPIDPVAGHIPGAINKPFAENINPDGTWKSVEELRARFAPLLESRKGDEIVFYCGSGVTACHNVLAFKHAGLGDAKLYPGSWSEWITDETRKVEC